MRGPGTPDRPAWILLGGTATAVLALGAHHGPAPTLESAVLPGLGVAVLAGVMVAGRALHRPRLAAIGTAFLQLTLFTLLGVVLSYAVAARGGPLWDERLARWDAILGIDWPLVRTWADRSGPLATLMALAYHSLVPQMVVVVVALGYLSRFDRLRELVVAAILAGLATIAISGLMPAAGNLFDPERFHHLWPPVALLQADLIAGLRDGSVQGVDLGDMQGIVTFPSYHATMAALFILGFRSVPWLGPAGMLWAGLTIAATPLGGGHYAVDVVAGLLLVPPSWLAARLLLRDAAPWSGRQRLGTVRAQAGR